MTTLGYSRSTEKESGMADQQCVLTDAGFQRAGDYAATQFRLDPAWVPRKAVYAWVHAIEERPTPIRVGVACGRAGMGSRYALYNRWLAARFKPNDPREQLVRALKIEGLGESAEVWAVEVPDPEAGRRLEAQLRKTWADMLSLDLMVRTSWIKGEMERRRRDGVTVPALQEPQHEAPTRSLKTSPDRSGMTAKLQQVEDWTRREFVRLDQLCRASASEISEESGPGRRYGFGRGRWFCRLHPKQGYIAIGLPPVMSRGIQQAGLARPPRKDAAWLDHTPQTSRVEVERLIAVAADTRRLA
jgi:hypothetical protein